MAGKTCPEQAQLAEGQNTEKSMNEWEWAAEVYQ